MINFKQLEAFILVADEENFTKAAKALFMTQPAISFQIKALEDHFQCRLFERLEKKTILTEAGRTVYPTVKEILGLYEQAKDAVNELHGMSRGTINVGASTIPGEYLLPLLIGFFKVKLPGLQVNLKITDSGQVVEDILARKIDFGVIGARYEDPNLVYQPFVKDEIIFISPKGHGLLGEAIKLKDLAKEALILREPGSGTRKVILERLAIHNVSLADLQVVMELGSTRAVITAVEAGLGVSAVSRWAAKDALELGRVEELKLTDFDGKRDLFIVSSITKYMGKAAKTFLDFVGECNWQKVIK